MTPDFLVRPARPGDREAIAEWEAAVAIDATSDIGRRSADNIMIIKEMMSAEMPEVGGR